MRHLLSCPTGRAVTLLSIALAFGPRAAAEGPAETPAADPPVAAVPAAAVLRLDRRIDADATHLVTSPDGRRVLVYGEERATLLAPDGTAAATVEVEGLTHGAVSDGGTFVLAHGGGVTVHNPANRREQLRIAAPDAVTGVGISADASRIAVASAAGVTVSDAVSGRTRFAVDRAGTGVAFDPDGYVWLAHEEGATRYDSRGRARGDGTFPAGPGILADGCIGPADGGGLCVSAPAWHGGDGLVSLDAEGGVEVWSLLGDGDTGGGPTPAEVTALAAAGGAVLVAHADGTLERRTADDQAVQVPLPGCAPCVPSAGGDDAGFWALGAGTFQAWDPAGAPSLKRPVTTDLVAAGRLADGRWVGLDPEGRVRIGGKLGKGRPRAAVVSPVGIDAAGDTVAVWSATEVQVLDGEGLVRSTPGIGADRAPVAVRVSPDGTRVAVIDDAGALHLYEATGRPVFRLQVGLQGTALAFDPTGAVVYAGGQPLRGFLASDGTETVRVLLPGGVEAAAVRGDGGLVLVQQHGDGHALRVIGAATLAPPPAPEEEEGDQPEPEGPTAAGG